MDANLLTGVLEPLAPTLLLGARLGGLLLIAPVFAARAVPTRLRMAVLIVIVVALHPSAAASASAAATITPVSLIGETIIGLVVGLGATVFLGAAETAGEWTAVQMGLAGATTINPLSTESTPVMGNFLSMTAMAMLLAVDGHLVMLDAVLATTDAIPHGNGASRPGRCELAT